MAAKNYSKVIVLGSGPAGCTAATYAALARLNPILITGNEVGGQLTKALKVPNWPGEPENVSGSQLMEKILQQVQARGVQLTYDTAVKIDLAQPPFRVQGYGEEYFGETLILAMGTSSRFLGLAREKEYLGRGISTCAVCDGSFYRNKSVIVVGGGNTMANEVLSLSSLVAKATVVHRRKNLHANPQLLEKIQQLNNVEFKLNSMVEEILVDANEVTGLKIRELDSGQIDSLEATGIFLAIGLEPNSQLVDGQLELADNFIKTGYELTSQTSVPGVFAAGDLVYGHYRQAVVAAGSGCGAALDAKKFLQLKL